MEEKFLHAEEPEAERNLQFQTKRDLNSSSSASSFPGFDVARLKTKNTFARNEKLKSKKIIEQLFREGKSVSKNGFTLVYLITPLPALYPSQAGFSVPKKFFKNAVHRNRIKRLMREIYRVNKLALFEKLIPHKKQIALMFVYKGKSMPVYKDVSEALLNCLNRISVV